MLLPLYTRNERIFLRDFRQTVEDAVKKNPICTMENIIELFGTPQDVVSEYMDTLDQMELCQQITKQKKLRRLLALLTILALIAFGLRIRHHYQAYISSINAIPVEIEEVIE